MYAIRGKNMDYILCWDNPVRCSLRCGPVTKANVSRVLVVKMEILLEVGNERRIV